MFKLNNEILKLYGRLMDDSELPAEVQTALRFQHRRGWDGTGILEVTQFKLTKPTPHGVIVNRAVLLAK